MFVSLGFRNAWRNRGKTLMGVVSMAVATIIFASSATLSQGYPANAYFAARQLLGADILLLPGKSIVSQEDLASSLWSWRFEKTSLDQPNSTLGFNLTPFYYGSMQGESFSGNLPGPSEISEQAERLRREPSIGSAEPKKALPFLYTYEQDSLLHMGYGYIEPRNPKNDLEVWGIESALGPGGRYLDAADGSNSAAVLCGGWAGMSFKTGQELTIEIPQFAPGGDGRYYFDYENPFETKLEIVGTVSFADGAGALTTKYANPSVFVTPDLFDELCEHAGFEPGNTQWGIGVTVSNMSILENVAAWLQRECPDYSVITAPSLADAVAGTTGLPTGVPLDMRKVTEALAFLTAALLSATNLMVLMMSRKTEIGILRSLGATQWNIICMVLTESIWIALLGGIAGNLISQPAVFWNLLSNKLGSHAILREVMRTAGHSLGFAVAAAAVFGFLPVAKALRVTPAQVLRSE